MPVLNIHNEEAYDKFPVEGEHGLSPQYMSERQKERERQASSFSKHVSKVRQNVTA